MCKDVVLLRVVMSLALMIIVLLPAHLPAEEAPAPDVVPQGAPIPAGEAAGAFKLPEGFNVTLLAAEPDVVQPIAFAFDGRGRLWVAESYAYPDFRQPDEKGDDRVLIFEDTDGDGRFDKKKVFWDQAPNVSGIEVGFGGVYLCSTPRLLFVPDRNGDDLPDGEPEVLLDGWNFDKAQHNVFNGLTWAPDGWLWGLNGIQSKSAVGKPGASDEERVKFDCGVWRYHPTRHEFEVVAWGTTNPWGLDFDDFGQPFITNCVISHLWHVIPGAHYKRMYGQDYNPHVAVDDEKQTGLMESCADHLHWEGGDWTEARGGLKHSDAGGGHAHVGAMIYLGDNWPDACRNALFTFNLHGRRINQDLLEPIGSGYVARHGGDLMHAGDEWFRGLELAYGPDGGVYFTDWSDTGECHDFDHADISNGRIFKITYGEVKPAKVDVEAMSDDELVQLQLHKNDWFVRQARKVLQERAAAGKLAEGTGAALREILSEHEDVTRKLRALWALHAIGGLSEEQRLDLLDHAAPYVVAWAMQLELEDRQASDAFLTRLRELALNHPSPVVRLHVASILQRVPLEQRWPITEALVSHADDAADPNIPLMIWYAVEPLVPADRTKALNLLVKTKIPAVREHLTRRIAATK